ncbi:hypothetical protein P175DRAFT_0524584 [Aspergillus ochraceoroseus IBT 24754]|uniref:Enoyl reductase (ER) domain-containing protein n=2 Tax=Aspergillus ochraceoroseus TaxID=138278 RepID=A0A2T5LVM9_9EURO|nr:uncharacterized protein P175DRAFT_0524584 [Aspergillus ochraceoroseus IBT 24754]KKK24077.1 hypothetical protein AOCH_005321 [Aspergillus ochraceoroseus]PTU20342.1 hypothetical protein P175DRAFT_0524584 [Aspergillus ochraceoroseus IBT 24754]
MLAAAWQGKNTITVVEIPKPQVINASDVVVKVTGTTVCDNDLLLFNGTLSELQIGDVLGHECCGIVESIGPDITKVEKGQRVMVSFPLACGNCKRCKMQLYSHCEKASENCITNASKGTRAVGGFDYSHFAGGFVGAQAEFVRVPYGDVNLLPIPDDVSDEKALYLSDVIGTAWHCVADTGIQAGDVVVVWGAGPVGQMCVDFGFFNGASRVILIDGGDTAWRLGYVKSKIPEVETLDFTGLPHDKSLSSHLVKIIGGEPDVFLECAGEGLIQHLGVHSNALLEDKTNTPEVLNGMINGLRPFGRVGISGIYAGFTNHFDIGSLIRTGARLIGNGQAPVQKYWEGLLELVEQYEIDPLHMVSHRYRLEDIDKVYALLSRHEKGVQKVFLQTRYSVSPSPGRPALTVL